MSHPFDSAASLHSSKRFLLRLVAIVAVLNAIVIALACLALHKSRVRYEDRAQTAATNIALFQERDLATTIEQVDLVLQTIADEALETESGSAPGGEGMNAFILRQGARLPALHGLRVTNARGDVIHGMGMV
jgi:hypothetical protein